MVAIRDSRFPGLEIDENLPFQRKAWRAQRIAFFLLLVITGLSVAGLFGSGPLSRTINVQPDTGLKVEFERFVRYGAPNRLKFELPAGVANDGKVDLWLSKAWVEAVKIESIAPEPSESLSHPDGFTYSFKVSDPARPGWVIFRTVPRTAGMLHAEAAVAEATPLEFSQFVYP